MPDNTPTAYATIPVASPRQTYIAHRKEIDLAIASVLNRGSYILGDEVRAFETDFARYIGVRHCIAVGSGTDSLQLALRACGVGSGDRVLTVSNTAVATVAAIHLVGGTAVLLDVHPTFFTLDPECAERAIGKVGRAPVRAIVPVHLYGQPCDMDAVLEIASRHALYVIEDCAQSHGAVFRGRRTGALGHLGCFSFYPTKNLGALGDGGAVVTDDNELAARLRLLRQYGWSERYVSIVPGMNTRLDELQAAILRVKLRYLDAENARRRAIAEQYDVAFDFPTLRKPAVFPKATHVYHQYVVRHRKRDELRSHLQQNGVGTAVLYPVPIHRQPGYENLVEVSAQGLAETERASREIVSLPMHSGLTDVEVTRVISLVADWASRNAQNS